MKITLQINVYVLHKISVIKVHIVNIRQCTKQCKPLCKGPLKQKGVQVLSKTRCDRRCNGSDFQGVLNEFVAINRITMISCRYIYVKISRATKCIASVMSSLRS